MCVFPRKAADNFVLNWISTSWDEMADATRTAGIVVRDISNYITEIVRQMSGLGWAKKAKSDFQDHAYFFVFLTFSEVV